MTNEHRALDFGPLTSFVGFRLRTAQLVFYADFLKRAPIAGVTPGQFAIMMLVEHNRGLTQQALCDGIRIEKSTLVVRLHRLTERGWLRRVRSSDDRRQNTLELTADGKKTLRAIVAFVQEHEERMLAELSETERKQLSSTLSKIVRTGTRAGRTPTQPPAPKPAAPSSRRRTNAASTRGPT